MPLAGDGIQDDGPHIQQLITDAGNRGIVEVPHTGAGYYICNTKLVIPDGVTLVPGPKTNNSAYYAHLYASRAGAVVGFDDSAGNPNHCDANILGFKVINGGSGHAIDSDDVLFMGRIDCYVAGGATGPVVDLDAQSAQINLRVFQNAADGGLLGNSLLKAVGNNNRITVNTNEAARTGAGWTNGSPIVHIKDGSNNVLTDTYIETTWGNGQDGYHLLVDNAEVLLRSTKVEPHLSGTATITSNRSIKLTNGSALLADSLGFLGDNGATLQGKLYVDATSAAHINYWSILTSLTNVCEFASSTAGRITGSTIVTTGSNYANTAQVKFDRYVTSANRLTEAVINVNRVRRD
jgi:hypothetical protein